MKKLFCLILTFLMLFSFCACSKDKKDNTDNYVHDVDIAYYASIGKIPELEQALGADPEEIINNKTDDNAEAASSEDHSGHSHAAPELTKTEGELSVVLNGGSYLYFDEKAKAENGISAMVSLEKAYGLEIGSHTVTEDTVKKALSKHTPSVSTPTQDDLFFLPDAGENTTALVYTFNEKYKLQFIFIDGTFSAVMLSDIQNWTI